MVTLPYVHEKDADKVCAQELPRASINEGTGSVPVGEDDYGSTGTGSTCGKCLILRSTRGSFKSTAVLAIGFMTLQIYLSGGFCYTP